MSGGPGTLQAVTAASGALASAFLEGTMRTATPLALAATGELVVERAGVINIGLEGVIIAGAFGALAGASHGSTSLGYAVAAAAGVLAALIFGLVVVGGRGDQIIAGMALTLLSLGVTGTLYRTWYGDAGAALSIATSRPIAIPWLSDLPLVGRALFAQPAITYVAYVVVPLLWWWMTRTHAGLALRAVGESPLAAEAAGIAVRRIRFGAVLFGGLMGGLAGGVLVLAQAGTFVEGMSAGRGFIAIAIVVLGRWRPTGVALAALLFGGTTALQYLAQAMGLDLPYQLFLALPYALTLAALAGVGGRATPPATLARIE
jgi:simple sugar transport system permease protein